MKETKEKHLAFQLSRTEVYEVHVEPNVVSYGIGGPYRQNGFRFSSEAEVFNRPKTDFNRCGQCQEEVTKNYLLANSHWKKWDKYHLGKVTPELYDEWLEDLKALKEAYNYVEKEHGATTFNEVRDLSMEKVKKPAKK